jgi:hypothetical protein
LARRAYGTAKAKNFAESVRPLLEEDDLAGLSAHAEGGSALLPVIRRVQLAYWDAMTSWLWQVSSGGQVIGQELLKE